MLFLITIFNNKNFSTHRLQNQFEEVSSYGLDVMGSQITVNNFMYI